MADSRSRKELELVLKIKAEGIQNTTRAMNELAASSQKVEAATARTVRGLDRLAGGVDAREESRARMDAVAASRRPVVGLGRLAPGGGVLGGPRDEFRKRMRRAGLRPGDVPPPGGGGVGGILAATGISAALLRFAGPAFAVTAAARGGLAAISAARDENLTGSQRNRMVAGSLPFGQTILGASDVLTGRGRAMQRIGEESQVTMGQTGVQSAIERLMFEQTGRVDALTSRAEAIRGAGPRPTLPFIDPTRAGADRRLMEERKLLDLRVKSANAEEDAAAAAGERTRANVRLEEVSKRQVALESRRKALEGEVGRLGNVKGPSFGPPAGSFDPLAGFKVTTVGAGRLLVNAIEPDITALVRGGESPDVARKRVQEQVAAATQAENANRDLLLRAKQQAEEAGQRQIEAQARQRSLAGPEALRTRADILEQRGITALSADQRLGALSYGQTATAVQALQFVKANPDFAPPDLLALAAQVAPDDIAEVMRQRGRASPFRAELERLAPTTFTRERPADSFRKAADLREAAARADVDIQQEAVTAGRDLAVETAKALVDVLRQFKVEIANQIKQELLRVKAGNSG